ncbi:MAG TPA: glycosyltransferase family 2 protein [Lachnospiraceae bacterium]|nr:glycosyltransferase family 2 protein [Lachnospiraceae bacterium]
MQKLLTISVAAYNVEKYIKECLDSFIGKSFMNYIEVLVVNDGSADNTALIASRYQKKYPDTFRVINKENGGHGSAVNCGIAEAKGKYFKTVDGDDWVDKHAFKELVDFIKITDADVISTDYWWVDDSTKHKIKKIKNTFKGMEYRKTYLFDNICRDIYINIHAMAIKTEILQNNNIMLDRHCFYVDAEYVLFPVPYIKTVAFLPKPVYMYRLGLSTQSMDILNMQKNCAHHEKVLKRIIQLYNNNKKNLSLPKKEYLEKAIAKLATSQIKIYLSYPASPDMKRKIVKLDKGIRKKYPQIYKKMANRAVYLLRKSNYRLYNIASAILRKTSGI